MEDTRTIHGGLKAGFWLFGFLALGGLKFSQIKGVKYNRVHPSSNTWGLFTFMEPFPVAFRTNTKHARVVLSKFLRSMPGTADPIAVFWDHRAGCLGKMALKGLGKKRLAKLWEKTSTIRARFRKGNPWLRLVTTEEGDTVVDTAALKANHLILQMILRTCAMTAPTIPEMTKEVWPNSTPHDVFKKDSCFFGCLTKGGLDILDYLLL